MSEGPPEPPPTDAPPPDPRQTVVLLAIFVQGGLFVAAVVLGWLLDQSPLNELDWDFAGLLYGLLATAPLVLIFFVLQRWPVGPLGRIQKFSERVIRPLLAPCSVVDLFGISVLAGLGEEMLFRGVLQGAFLRWWGLPWLAVATASLLFGLVHAITFTYAVLAGLMGAYLGLVWLYSGNLLAAIVAHALYDFVVLLWLLRGPGSSAPAEEAKEGAAEPQSEK
jgi:membrane protease YdiL (CAAX protease family)